MNWIRLNVQSIDRASDLASMVLPTPGTSSMRTWPPETRQLATCSETCRLPWMTRSMLVTMALKRCRNPSSASALTSRSALLGGAAEGAGYQRRAGRRPVCPPQRWLHAGFEHFAAHCDVNRSKLGRKTWYNDHPWSPRPPRQRPAAPDRHRGGPSPGCLAGSSSAGGGGVPGGLVAASAVRARAGPGVPPLACPHRLRRLRRASRGRRGRGRLPPLAPPPKNMSFPSPLGGEGWQQQGPQAITADGKGSVRSTTVGSPVEMACFIPLSEGLSRRGLRAVTRPRRGGAASPCAPRSRPRRRWRPGRWEPSRRRCRPSRWTSQRASSWSAGSPSTEIEATTTVSAAPASSREIRARIPATGSPVRGAASSWQTATRSSPRSSAQRRIRSHWANPGSAPLPSPAAGS